MTPEDVRELFETVTTTARPDQVDVEAAARRGRSRLRWRAAAAGMGAAATVAAVTLIVVPLVTGPRTGAGPADPATTSTPTSTWVDTPAPAGCLPFDLFRPGKAPASDPRVERLEGLQERESEKVAAFGALHPADYVSTALDTDPRSPCLHVWWLGAPPPQLQDLIGTLTSQVWVHRARWTHAELTAGVDAAMSFNDKYPQGIHGQYVCSAGVRPEAVSVRVCVKEGTTPSGVDPELAAAVRELTDVDVVLTPSAPISLL